MKILVDTSVWADFFNGHRSRQTDALADFIDRESEIATCGVVLAEFFQGLKKSAAVARLLPYFLELTNIAPREVQTYLDAADLYRRLRQRGISVRSTIDCLIVCLAAENECLLLAKDRDIQLILESSLTVARPAPLPLDLTPTDE